MTLQERVLEDFEKLEWPMHLSGTGVDMEMHERDKQIESFLLSTITQVEAETLERVLESLPEERMLELEYNSHEEIVDAKNDWNDCLSAIRKKIEALRQTK